MLVRLVELMLGDIVIDEQFDDMTETYYLLLHIVFMFRDPEP